MSSPQQVAASLRKTARQLERIPDTGLRDCAEAVADVANRLGGTFGAKRKRLTVNIKPGKDVVVIRGTPAGAWAIRSFGRSESVARGRALGTKGGSFHAKRSPATGGDGRWDRVRHAAEDESPRIIAESVSKAMK